MRSSVLLAFALLFPALAAESEVRPVTTGKEAGEEWTNALRTTFCWCPKGTFKSESGEKVAISRGFWLGKYEITKREFDLVTPKKPPGALATDPDHPRDAIRHDDILQFVRELNRRERFSKHLPEGWIYALPTQAEWEYACRAGTDSVYSFGDDLTELPANGNFADRRLFETKDDFYRYADRKLDDGIARLSKVGKYKANPWGFHDMHGNLWEWTASYDTAGNPIARGGSWVSRPDYCRSGYSRSFPTETERNFIGFRLALKRKTEPEDTAPR